MQTRSRIPRLTEVSFDGAKIWFDDMRCRHLLFHPEDDPVEIVRIDDGKPVFSAREVTQVRDRIGKLEKDIGHAMVIEAAYPAFMNAFGQTTE